MSTKTDLWQSTLLETLFFRPILELKQFGNDIKGKIRSALVITVNIESHP